VLHQRFPGSSVVQVDAAALTDSLGSLRGTVDYVISGLPIVWFSRDKKTRILKEAFALLRSRGRYQQFTYLGCGAPFTWRLHSHNRRRGPLYIHLSHRTALLPVVHTTTP